LIKDKHADVLRLHGSKYADVKSYVRYWNDTEWIWNILNGF